MKTYELMLRCPSADHVGILQRMSKDVEHHFSGEGYNSAWIDIGMSDFEDLVSVLKLGGINPEPISLNPFSERTVTIWGIDYRIKKVAPARSYLKVQVFSREMVSTHTLGVLDFHN